MSDDTLINPLLWAGFPPNATAENRYRLIFENYWKTFKPILAEVEACREVLPAGVLNEIRNLFDHLARIHRPDQPISGDYAIDNLNKALGHLKRAILDCFKHAILYYHEELERCLDSFPHDRLALVNNGAFYPELMRLREAARRHYRIARMRESAEREEVALDQFQHAYNAYKRAMSHVNENIDGIAWAMNQISPPAGSTGSLEPDAHTPPHDPD